MQLVAIPHIKEMIDSGYISVRKHSKFDLYIYNYTKKAGANRVWNEATNKCRGLICDGNGTIVARPFEKFYNYEELDDLNITIPKLPFEVYEKLDGSLGIMYFAEGNPYIATRGSFDSDQAKHATDILYHKYSHTFSKLDQSKTYLFEIIYNDPTARGNLVVDYGNVDDIFLLAVIHTATGEEDDISDYKDLFKVTTKYDSVKDYLKFRNEQDGHNREGFVIKFSNNFRMKLKFSEYFKHHAMHRINAKDVVSAIVEKRLDSFRENLVTKYDEEVLLYLDNIIVDLNDKYAQIEDECISFFHSNKCDSLSRVELAHLCKDYIYASIIFALYDSKNITPIIWRFVRKHL